MSLLSAHFFIAAIVISDNAPKLAGLENTIAPDAVISDDATNVAGSLTITCDPAEKALSETIEKEPSAYLTAAVLMLELLAIAIDPEA